VSTHSLTFTINRDSDRTRLTIAGEVDLGTRESLISTAINALERTASTLELDLAGVTFCDSSGVSGFLAIHRIAANDGKRMIVTNPRGQLERTLTVAGLLTMLTGQEPG
jgi:anti-sigma B factor antagonist